MMRLRILTNNTYCHVIVMMALMLVPATLLLTGCGGSNQSSLLIPVATPTPRSPTDPTPTPRPRQSPFIGTYKGTYSATFPPGSTILGTRTGDLTFTVRADGSVAFANGASTPTEEHVTGSGHCDLTSGRISWGSRITFGRGIRSFSGQLQSGSGGMTGSGTVGYIEHSEVASGPWQVKKQ